MSKLLGITCICMIIIIISVSIVRISQITLTLLLNDGVVWCNDEDRAYISKYANIYNDFNIVTCHFGFRGDHKFVEIYKNFPYLWGEKIKVEDTDVLYEYVSENNDKTRAIIIFSLPYIIIIIAGIIWIKIVLLPKFTKNRRK